MKNSWQEPVGQKLLLRLETKKEQQNKCLLWPLMWIYICTGQVKDICSFCCYSLFQGKSAKNGANLVGRKEKREEKETEIKKCRTRTGETLKEEIEEDKNNKENEKSAAQEDLKKRNWLIKLESGKQIRIRREGEIKKWSPALTSLILSFIIIAQLPLLEKNWTKKRWIEENPIIKNNYKEEILKIPANIKVNGGKLIKVKESELKMFEWKSEASIEASLTQEDKINLSLIAAYKNDWVDHQEWLEKAREMDPNEFFFIKSEN